MADCVQLTGLRQDGIQKARVSKRHVAVFLPVVIVSPDARARKTSEENDIARASFVVEPVGGDRTSGRWL